ncbi:MAG: ExeM/NucH family extracellular endonuclease [Planctomycetota bacterium]|nr:ExeM/NucH family extracellular endonuclease [Planctomycetota bacterium]
MLGFLMVVGARLSQSIELPTPQLIPNLGAASLLPVDAVAVNPDGSEAHVVIRGDLSLVNWRDYLGKNITIEGDLVINDTYDLARRGQITVARNRLFIPTSQVDPNDPNAAGQSFDGRNNVDEVNRLQKLNDQSTLIIDDQTTKQNVFPPPLFPGLGKKYATIRLGSIVNGVNGRLEEYRNRIVLRSEKPLQWIPASRPARPDLGNAAVTVASFNVLNYFTTIDNGRNNARGADTASEFSRQEAKIVAAITQLDADVIGLMEIENSMEAETRLVSALNAKLGKEIYKGCGVPANFDQSPGGSDAIRVGIIYRTDRVSTIDPVSMISDDSFIIARTPLVQKFKSHKGRQPFTVIVNHWKSKGGSGGDDQANKNNGDGQAAYNGARRSQALAITKFIEGLPSRMGQDRILVIGDLNAYQQEDPIDLLRAKGLVDLTEQFLDRTANAGASIASRSVDYSFVYFGQSGSLDHAFATPSIAKDVTGVAAWHINADEPRFLDYNEEYNPAGIYVADPYRSSDHDPVLIGLRN